jgi:hypothetical protein
MGNGWNPKHDLDVLRSRARNLVKLRRIWVMVVCLTVIGMINMLLFTIIPSDTAVRTQTDNVPAQSVALTATRRVECGAKSLYLINSLLDRKTDLQTIRRLTKTVNGSTTMSDLKAAAQALGIRSEAVGLSFSDLLDDLRDTNSMAILHARNDHFFPVMSAGNKRVRAFDPAIGIAEVDESHLISHPYEWDGTALILRARLN